MENNPYCICLDNFVKQIEAAFVNLLTTRASLMQNLPATDSGYIYDSNNVQTGNNSHFMSMDKMFYGIMIALAAILLFNSTRRYLRDSK